jgi:hypothetical protein
MLGRAFRPAFVFLSKILPPPLQATGRACLDATWRFEGFAAQGEHLREGRTLKG